MALKPLPGLIDAPIPGLEATLGPWRVFVPPMLLRDMRQSMREGLLADIANLKVSSSADPDVLDKIEKAHRAALLLIHRSLKRNYPTLAVETVEELLDAPQCGALVSIVIDVNLETQDRPTWAGPWGEALPTPPSPTLTNGSGLTSSAAAPAPLVGQ